MKHASVDKASMIAPHEQRVLDESAELHERINRLVAFVGENPIYQTLPHDEKRLLSQQLQAMQAYHGALKARIMRFIR